MGVHHVWFQGPMTSVEDEMDAAMLRWLRSIQRQGDWAMVRLEGAPAL